MATEMKTLEEVMSHPRHRRSEDLAWEAYRRWRRARDASPGELLADGGAEYRSAAEHEAAAAIAALEDRLVRPAHAGILAVSAVALALRGGDRGGALGYSRELLRRDRLPAEPRRAIAEMLARAGPARPAVSSETDRFGAPGRADIDRFGLSGRTVGQYLLEEPLGSGGPSAIYTARAAFSRQRLVVKVLDQIVDPRFIRELTASQRLRHPGIVRVLDVGIDPSLGVSFMVTELVRGRSLQNELGKSRWSPAGAVQLMREIAEPIAAAHADGIVHRDLRPTKILLVGEHRHEGVKILGLGLRGPWDESRGLTLVGAPSYMSPEQFSFSRVIGPETDVWALGVILYQLLAGRLPFEAENVNELVLHILEGNAPGLPAHIPPALQHLVARALARDPRDRFRDAGELRAALDSVARAEGLGDRTTSPMLVRDVGSAAQEPRGYEHAAPSSLRVGCLAAIGILALLAVALLIQFHCGPAPRGVEDGPDGGGDDAGIENPE